MREQRDQLKVCIIIWMGDNGGVISGSKWENSNMTDSWNTMDSESWPLDLAKLSSLVTQFWCSGYWQKCFGVFQMEIGREQWGSRCLQRRNFAINKRREIGQNSERELGPRDGRAVEKIRCVIWQRGKHCLNNKID